MNMVPESNKGEDCDFCKLLSEVKQGKRSVGELLDDPIYIERARLMVQAQSQGPNESREILHELRDKVWAYISSFKPDYAYDYGKFFIWLRELARVCFYDRLRDEDEDEDSDEHPQALSSKYDNFNYDIVYFEEQDQLDACASELESCISNLPERTRLACTEYILDGSSPRETARLLTRAGYPCTEESVLQWISEGLKSFFPQIGGFAIDETERGAGPGKPAGIRDQSSSATKAVNPSVGNSSKR